MKRERERKREREKERKRKRTRERFKQFVSARMGKAVTSRWRISSQVEQGRAAWPDGYVGDRRTR